MNILRNFSRNASQVFIALALVGGLASCSKDDDVTEEPAKKSMTYNYAFSDIYAGSHPTNFSAQMMVEEIDNSSCKITVTLMNTIDGQTYNVHAHDAADASTTPNGTPYNETPNANVFVQMIPGNGGSATASQTANMSYEQITASYEAFFVVHDPTQAMSTTDLSTYLVVGAFAR